MSYLTDEERKMPLDMQFGQLVLGLQSCKTKGDTAELIKEAYEMGRIDEREKIVDKLHSAVFDMGDRFPEEAAIISVFLQDELKEAKG